MTYEEALKYFKNNEEGKNGATRYLRCKKKAIKALEKQEKYRWHDLRKDPNDLPKEHGEYLVAYVLYGTPVYTVYDVYYYGTPHIYGRKKKECFYFSDSEYGDCECDRVIAWKEIETFEDEV